MDRISRSISKIDDDVRSAGQTFLGLNMESLLTKIKDLDDKVLKSKLIEGFHSSQYGYYDKDMGGTRTRINSAVRIIKADKVLYVLEKIDGSNPLVLPEAVMKAKETVMKIREGKLRLPKLDL